MSDRPIQVGDLVQVVRVCCSIHEYGIGAVFGVSRISSGDHTCKACGYRQGRYASSEGLFLKDCDRAPLSWLKRIPPLSELEGQRAEEKLKEPA